MMSADTTYGEWLEIMDDRGPMNDTTRKALRFVDDQLQKAGHWDTAHRTRPMTITDNDRRYWCRPEHRGEIS